MNNGHELSKPVVSAPAFTQKSFAELSEVPRKNVDLGITCGLRASGGSLLVSNYIQTPKGPERPRMFSSERMDEVPFREVAVLIDRYAAELRRVTLILPHGIDPENVRQAYEMLLRSFQRARREPAPEIVLASADAAVLYRIQGQQVDLKSLIFQQIVDTTAGSFGNVEICTRSTEVSPGDHDMSIRGIVNQWGLDRAMQFAWRVNENVGKPPAKKVRALYVPPLKALKPEGFTYSQDPVRDRIRR